MVLQTPDLGPRSKWCRNAGPLYSVILARRDIGSGVRVMQPHQVAYFKGWRKGSKMNILTEDICFYFSTNFKLLSLMKGNSILVIVLKFTILVMGGHRNYSPWAPKYLVMPLLSSLTEREGSFEVAVPRDSVSFHCYNCMVLHFSEVSASPSQNKRQYLNLKWDLIILSYTAHNFLEGVSDRYVPNVFHIIPCQRCMGGKVKVKMPL